jgi:hypothetical protein
VRANLVIGVAVLIAVVCAVVGVATEAFLGRYLRGQLDGQVSRIHQVPVGPDASNEPGTTAHTTAISTRAGQTVGGALPGAIRPRREDGRHARHHAARLRCRCVAVISGSFCGELRPCGLNQFSKNRRRITSHPISNRIYR